MAGQGASDKPILLFKRLVSETAKSKGEELGNFQFSSLYRNPINPYSAMAEKCKYKSATLTWAFRSSRFPRLASWCTNLAIFLCVAADSSRSRLSPPPPPTPRHGQRWDLHLRGRHGIGGERCHCQCDSLKPHTVYLYQHWQSVSSTYSNYSILSPSSWWFCPRKQRSENTLQKHCNCRRSFSHQGKTKASQL